MEPSRYIILFIIWFFNMGDIGGDLAGLFGGLLGGVGGGAVDLGGGAEPGTRAPPVPTRTSR